MSFKRCKRSSREDWAHFILARDLFIYLFILQHKYKYPKQEAMTCCSWESRAESDFCALKDLLVPMIPSVPDCWGAVTFLQHYCSLFAASVDDFTP